MYPQRKRTIKSIRDTPNFIPSLQKYKPHSIQFRDFIIHTIVKIKLQTPVISRIPEETIFQQPQGEHHPGENPQA